MMRSSRNLILIGAGIVLLALGGWLILDAASGYTSNWAYEMSGVRAAQSGADGSGITVAVIDTGFNAQHPSLSQIELKAWRDMVLDRPEPYDDLGHGSHVAGILAGQGATFAGKYQGFNMKGAAPGIELVAVKVIAADGTGSSDAVAEGVEFAVAQGSDIICMSLGSRTQPLNLVSDRLTSAVNAALDRGILVVAAAGNTGESADRDDVESPASFEGVIAVGSVGRDKQVSSFSAVGSEEKNYGLGTLGLAARPDPHKKPEIVAPGEEIISAWKGDTYSKADGTSQAAPFVCGALALLLEENPQLRSDNSRGLVNRVKRALAESAEELPGGRDGHDPREGYGLLRADRLLAEF